MDIKAFEYFLALSEEGVYSKAADRVCITPQGLSNTVHRLENHFGVPLVVPDNKGVSLTAYGQIVANCSRKMLQNFEDAKREISALQQSEAAEIRLAASPGLINYFPADFIGKRLERDGLTGTVTLTQTASDFNCELALLEDQCDFSLVVDPIDHTHFVSLPLYRDIMFAWVNSAHPLSCKESLDIKDLHNQKVVFVSNEFRQAHIFTSLITEESKPSEIIQVDEMIEVLQRATQNSCIAITVRPHAEKLKVENVKALPITNLAWGFSLVYKKTKLLSPVDEAFIDYLRSQAHFYF
jgi:DNA-binding transcriptional LysR family regulator